MIDQKHISVIITNSIYIKSKGFQGRLSHFYTNGKFNKSCFLTMLLGFFQQLYQTLTDYDIRYYLFELLKVRFNTYLLYITISVRHAHLVASLLVTLQV